MAFRLTMRDERKNEKWKYPSEIKTLNLFPSFIVYIMKIMFPPLCRRYAHT